MVCVEIEKLLPNSFRCTPVLQPGSCAAAAAKAALIALVFGEKLNEVSFKIPEGETMRMPVEAVVVNSQSAAASVIKDSGDDPDVTDGCRGLLQ